MANVAEIEKMFNETFKEHCSKVEFSIFATIATLTHTVKMKSNFCLICHVLQYTILPIFIPDQMYINSKYSFDHY